LNLRSQWDEVARAAPARPGRSKAAPPFSLRLTPEERAQLDRDAGSVPLGAYIRSRLIDGGGSPRRAVRKPAPDQAGLARVLAELGRSRLASNLNQLAKAANSGSLPVTPELEAELAAACADIGAMRAALITALGLKAE
jgi:hypothetical protein